MGSYCTSTSAAASSAIAALSAATATTISPVNRTFSTARMGAS
jgi:hypothetical protein